VALRGVRSGWPLAVVRPLPEQGHADIEAVTNQILARAIRLFTLGCATWKVLARTGRLVSGTRRVRPQGSSESHRSSPAVVASFALALGLLNDVVMNSRRLVVPTNVILGQRHRRYES
jgi:hypothetical protein